MRRFRLPLLTAALLAACTGDPSLDAADRTGVDSPGPAPSARSFHVPPALALDSRIAPTATWDELARRPRMVTGAFAVPGATSPEGAARQFLRRHADLFGLAADGSDLELTATRRGLAGTYLRFGQRAGGLPVLGAEVIVAVSFDGDEVRAVNLAHEPGLIAPAVIDVVGSRALAIARAHVGEPVEEAPATDLRGVLPGTKPGEAPRIVHRVTVAAAAPAATWEVTIDAASGAVLSARDRNRRADGTGLVFDMSPVQSTGVTTLTDGNDATNAALDAARFSVVLPRLDGTGPLKGPFVDARPANVANRATSPQLAFAYDRNDDHFEEVMLYYHLDRAQARIQALGFTNVNNRVQVAIANADNQDNSFYSPGNKTVRFGAGGVDDAEDADIILHEYGHSIQDNQVPGWGDGDADAMGEGFGDYLAASFGVALPLAAGRAQPADVACVGDWDAISYDNSTPPCLRRVDGTAHYPERYDGEVHTDGEMWSAALWRARTAVGGDVMDRLIFEGHFLMSTDESFDGAASAVIMADQMVNGGSHVPAVRRAMYRQGMLRTPMTPVFYSDATPETVDVRNPVDGSGLYANRIDNTQTITRPGATALRVRFATFATEESAQCAQGDGGCDNVYLYDGDGDLYQILHGSQAGAVSVQIPGDTIQIRLVSDGDTAAAGYVIDRVDVMSGAISIDAPLPIDAPQPIDARPIDAAPQPIDASMPVGDAAPQPSIDAALDAPAGPDAGGNPADGDETGGCGCRTGGGSGAPGAALSLGVLALVLRKRRRRS